MPSEAVQTTGKVNEQKSRKPRNVWVVIIYVVLVLGLDTLGMYHYKYGFAAWFNWPMVVRQLFYHFPIPWATYMQPLLSSFNVYKFVFWFVIPVLWCWRGMDWKAWNKERWTKLERRLLKVSIVILPLSMFLIPYIPGINQYYHGMNRGGGIDWAAAFLMLLWTLAWLPGWEFMHRYLLLGAVHKKWPNWGWLLVPISEFVYHLQKPPMEAVLMFAFGLVLTWYAVKRENFRFPFFMHLIVELSLILWLYIF